MAVDPEAVKMLEDEVGLLIMKSHHSGMNYWQILNVFMKCCLELMVQSEVEYHVKQMKD